MNDQQRTVSFDARLDGRGIAPESGTPACTRGAQFTAETSMSEPAHLRQNASGDQNLDGDASSWREEPESLHSRASPYNLRWAIRN